MTSTVFETVTPDSLVYLDRLAATDLGVWLVDTPGTNANLHYVLDQAAREVLWLRQDGKRVLLHCQAGQSRPPRRRRGLQPPGSWHRPHDRAA
jgi:protein-tyrosine phosphatase